MRLPVYVDIDPETYNIDPAKIEEAITPRTRAILPVYFGGELADVDAIASIAARHGLKVIEDAAQAQGVSLRGGRYAGSFGEAATFSFQASKCLNLRRRRIDPDQLGRDGRRRLESAALRTYQGRPVVRASPARHGIAGCRNGRARLLRSPTPQAARTERPAHGQCESISSINCAKSKG